MTNNRSTIEGIWAHHAWADAEHWRALELFPPALEDQALRERLHHVHLTQRAWIWAIGDRRSEFVFSTVTDFTDTGALKDFAIANHASLTALAAAETSELDRLIAVPWFDNLQLSVREGLTQVAMHSHYHRGQNATRFRELGGHPPGTDFITWISKGRPAPQWAV